MSWSGRIGRCTSVAISYCPTILLIFINISAAFTQREGLAISTITYNDHGEVRPIFYRLSLAEMVVPYGAPEHPHSRKFAFDS